MQKPESYLKDSIEGAKGTLKIGMKFLCLGLVLIFCWMLYPLTSKLFWGEPVGGVPWWGVGLMGLGSLALLVAGFLLIEGWREYRRYTRLGKGANAEVEMEITDKFVAIKLLPGDDGPLEFRYFISNAEGNWRLASRVESFFEKLEPGFSVKAALLQGGGLKEIAFVEILKEVKGHENLSPLQISRKIASEVKVTGYDEKGVMVNKWHLAKKVRYYFIIGEDAVEVTRATFHATPLYSEFENTATSPPPPPIN